MLITVITGPMKSGKSEKLLEMITECKVPYLVIKPSTDTRDSGKVVSRATEQTHHAAMIDQDNNETWHMLFSALAHRRVKTLFIDEVQFFSDDFMYILESTCAANGVDIVASGLSHDFKGEWFPSTFLLYNNAKTIHELTAICESCGCDNATENIRVNIMTNEKQYDGDSILVERDDNVLEYMVICNDCNWNKFDSRLKFEMRKGK